jgi:serine/threonine-protein kinase
VAVALAHQREQAPPLPPEIPLQVRELVNRAMAKNPPDRPPTAGDFGRAALALRDGLEGTRPMPAMGMPPTARLAGTRPAGTAVLPRTGPPPRRPEPPAPPARRRRNLRAPLIGLILLALLIGLFVLLHNVNSGTGVPDVKGLSLARAQTSLRAAGFQVKVNGGSAGVVQSQDPSAGHKAKKNSTVTLTFGNQTVEPAKTRISSSDYVGRRLGDVRSDLTGLGFGVSLSGSTSPDALVTSISPTGEVTNGSVISVTSRRQQTASPSATETTSEPSTSPTTSAPQSSSPSSSKPSSGSSGSGGGISIPIPGTGNNGKGNGNGGSNGNG